MSELLADPFSGDFLLVAFVATLAVGAVMRRPELAVAIGVVVAGDLQPRFVLAGAAVLGAVALAGGAGAERTAEVATRSFPLLVEIGVAVAAAGAIYACLPDTELALGVLGATVAAGLLRLARPADPGPGLRVAIGAGLGATAVLDGAARATALAAGLAVAALLACAALDGRRLIVLRGLVVVGAMAGCSRVFGVAAGGWQPVVAVVVLAAAVVALTWRLADRSG